MPRLTFTLIVFLSLFLCFSCQEEHANEVINNPKFLHATVAELTDIMVEDIFSPPVASRIYAYPSIAAYEVLVHDYPNYRSLVGQINGLTTPPTPNPNKAYHYPLASLCAYLTVAQKLVRSEERITAFEHKIYRQIKDLDIPREVYSNSLVYGEKVAKHILAWAENDNFRQTRNLAPPKLKKGSGDWQPTPPGYMTPIEPYWNKIRPMVLDSAQQYPPSNPTPFDMEKGSAFHNDVLEVFETVNNSSEEELAIASFWDCNPYVVEKKGKQLHAIKKITPGAHWVGITGLACKQSKANIMQTAEAYALVSIALMDGFISCWDEKYRSNLVRPETIINKHIDKDWLPILETPPFPEYTSGHSVISAASATMLTHLFGDGFQFKDTTEEKYGLPARTFPSFLAAADEAAISRLYGGIHYRPAVENGLEQGKQVGQYVVDHVITRR